MPDWWLTASGWFFILGSVFMIVAIVGMGALIWILLDLKVSLKKIAAKVESVSEKVDAVADTVQHVTHEIGVRTTGITRMVDHSAGTAMATVERFGPYLLGAVTLLRVVSSLKLFRKR